ncbi:hypothetical protein [Niveispirillum sp.]|uniref:response regulator n=1 Tax=Niveispirillum sp. TaxID=1917217 RepID=UPI001B6BCA3A|nr:hypothetical protein [Niveispirillum sp.]MBP7337704.1 PAS domain-containing protein [Niveispirillum sp.]
MTDNDDIFYADAPDETDKGIDDPWVVLIVDDDQAVHDITVFALGTTRFRDRPLRFLHAYSAKEGLELVRANDDLALIFLDVVMETEDAGLRFVHCVRRDLDRLAVRVVLRTGQPGRAPEKRIIVEYDINDYKEKTELTVDKLFVSTVAALRAYDDIRSIERLKDAAYNTLIHEAGLGRQLLDFVPTPLLHVDDTLSVTACNPPAAALLGLPADQLVGLPLTAFVVGDIVVGLAAGKTDLPVQLATGPGQLTARPFRLADGTRDGYLLRLDTQT